MPVELTKREILCHFLYIAYRVYREVRNYDRRWYHETLSKSAKLCEKLDERALAEMYDRASSGGSPREILVTFQARTGLAFDMLPVVFRDGTWKSMYGGPKWARIAQHALRLKQAIETNDHEESQRLSLEIYELQHNTGNLGRRKGWRPDRVCCVKPKG